MKIRSPFLYEMSGKLGNAVAANARGGITYFRALVTPANPSTFLQTAIRNALASAASYWKNALTELEREAWWDLAEGAQTGGTLFQRVNQPRIYAVNAGRVQNVQGNPAEPSFGVLTTPPESFSTELTSPSSIVADDSNNQLVLSGFNSNNSCFQGRATDMPSLIHIYASHQQQPSRFTRQHPYQLLASVQVEEGDDPSDITATIDLSQYGYGSIAGRVMYVKIIGQAPDGGISVPIEKRIEVIP